jgi:hypothetical protein
MADQQPQDQPRPAPDQPGRDWNEVSPADIEQKLSDAASLAYELAGDMGVAPDQPKFRETSELEAIESALDAELKQIDHLVGRAQEELGANSEPADAADPGAAKPIPSIPDFMAEFMTDEPVKVFPTDSDHSDPLQSTAQAGQTTGEAVEHEEIPGVVGVGTLRQRKGTHTDRDRARQTQPESRASSAKPKWAMALEAPAFHVCHALVGLLEFFDRPLAKLDPRTRRALSVTAIAAFCVCLLTFLLSVLIS